MASFGTMCGWHMRVRHQDEALRACLGYLMQQCCTLTCGGAARGGGEVIPKLKSAKVGCRGGGWRCAAGCGHGRSQGT